MVGLEKTPHYVLKAGTLTHEPSVVQSESGSATYAIFGFSDKPQYDRFLLDATEGLTPYPLVKRFLQDQLAQEADTLRLVILDPVSFDALEWKAATFESVLESIQSRSEFVKPSHRLVRQESSMSYRALPTDPSDPSGKQEKSTQGEKSNKPPSKEEQAKERVQKARERMQKAEKNLRAEKRKEAIEEQQQAEEELQQAIAELEKILMQLREEEIERTLVDLETRLKRMSEWETTIRQATEKLEKLSGEDKDRQLEIQASKLSTEQLKVAMEGQRAMLLLKDEGSSQAFPEALEQVIADAQLVVNRLVASDVSASTQSIQDEILGALDEMIESLQEVQKKRDEKKQQNQRQGPSDSGGQQQEESLVGKIAELRLIKTLQMRVNRRTGRLADESNQGEDLIGQVTDSRLQEELRELAKRQEKIQSVTRDILLEAAKQ